MKKGWRITLIIGVSLLIGGGVSYAMSIMDKNNAEYVRLKEYTEEYTTVSTNIKGYVSYTDTNKQFTVDFPEDFYILEKTHETSSDTFELFNVLYFNPETKKSDDGISKDIQVTYSQLHKGNLSTRKERVFAEYAYDGLYQETRLDELVFFTGESHFAIDGMNVEIKNPKENGTNRFFAFVFNEETKQSLKVIYSLDCFEENVRLCKINEEQERKTFKQILSSITFNRK